jgi:MFS family permease
VFLLSNALLPNGALLAWGWRLPFLCSVLLVAVGLYVRLNTSETPSFRKIRDTDARVKVPLAELLRKYWKQVLLGGVATISTGTSFNLIVAFGLTYGTQTLGYSRNAMLCIALIACALCVVMLPAFGWLSDLIGRKPVIIGGIVAEALLAFPLFWLLDSREFPFALLGYLLMMTAFAANYGPIATLLAELFGTRIRYSGLSVSYMLSGLLGSAATPIVTTALLSATGKGSSVGWFMVASAVISIAALLLIEETRKTDLGTAL